MLVLFLGAGLSRVLHGALSVGLRSASYPLGRILVCSSLGASGLSNGFRRWGLAGVLFVACLCPVSTGCFCASFVPLGVAYSFGIFGLAS